MLASRPTYLHVRNLPTSILGRYLPAWVGMNPGGEPHRRSTLAT